MSTASPYKTNEAVQKFETRDYRSFHVEFTERGDDIIYHFWPPEEESKFSPMFPEFLEKGFKEVLSRDTDVRAEYTDIKEAHVMHKEGVGMVPQKDMDRTLVFPRETIYVKVVAGLKNPMADKFMKHRIFEAVQSQIDRS
jgi:hypothetical protein